MSTEKTEIETFFGRCRCCLSYGYLKNMWTEHEFEGDTEIYGEMLVQCFALSFHHSEDAMEQDQICEQCVSRLRDANDFKKVVLDSQEELMQQVDAENQATIKEEIEDDKFLMVYEGPESEGDTADTTYADTEYTAGTGDTSESVKDEMEYEEIEYLEEDDAGETKEVVDTDSSLPTENRSRTVKRRKQAQPDSDEGPIKRKWPKRLPKSERLKTYKQYSEEDLRQCLEAVRNNELTPNEASLKYNIPKKTVCAKMKLDPKDAHAQLIKNTAETEDCKNNALKVTKAQKNNAPKVTRAQKNNASDIGKRQKNQNILSEFKANARSILKYSNATPIRGHWGIGYACIYCKYQNTLPSELKYHTLTTHSDNVDELDNVKYVSDMIIKLDITDLRCKLCDKKMDSLEDILEHLKYIHKQPIYLDINNHIVPFKFEKTFLECALCPKQFNYFKQISEHMNQHYPNYACPKCDRHFINKRSLRTHLNRHQTGTFVCSYCPKIFDTRIKMKEHERVLHLKGSKTRKCGYCDEKFMDDLRKTDHEVKEHGRPVPKFECKACGKYFDSQRSLKDHTNYFHLLLRPHTCPECNKGFYNKNEMKRHMIKHSKVKDFQCVICSKWYVTRSSLKSHMKLHENVEAYSCERCGQVFIQKKTWVRHMEQHAESLKNAESAENSHENA